MKTYPRNNLNVSIKTNSKGFTLIELLVALLIGLFLLGGVVSVFVSNQQSYRSNENLSRIQESARFAIEQIGREIRDAGFNHCGVRTVNNVIFQTTNSPNGFPWWANWNAGTLVGYDDNVSITGFNSQAFSTAVNRRVLGTDAILVLRSNMDEGLLYTVQNHDTQTAAITLDRSPPPGRLRDGDAMIICDGNSAAIFHLTSDTVGNSIDYSSTADFNCSQRLGWAYSSSVNCQTTATFKQFQPGSFLTSYDPAFWYVGASDATGGRSLYRTRMTVTNTQRPNMERQEMVPGVTNLQIEYLTKRKTSAPDVLPETFLLSDDWVSASDAKFSVANGGWTPANLEQAVAVRITLTLTSKDAEGIDTANNTTTAIERTVVAVFSIRNRER